MFQIYAENVYISKKSLFCYLSENFFHEYKSELLIYIQIIFGVAGVMLILTLDGGDLVGHDLVEDMVGALKRLLGDDTSLLKQVALNVSTGQLARVTEVNTDELTLCQRQVPLVQHK